MEAQVSVSGRKRLQQEPVERFIHSTRRTDWDALAAEIFDRVVNRCPYGIAAVTKRKVMRWHRLIVRINDLYEPAMVLRFVRRTLRTVHYDAIFRSTDGTVRDTRFDLYKIVGPQLGLPINSLVYRIQHEMDPGLRVLLVFGGERLEGHMERSLELVQKILAAPPTNAQAEKVKVTEEDFGSYTELIQALRDINVKQLDKMDIREVSDLANGLDEVIAFSPVSLRAKYRALNEHLLHRGRHHP